MDILNWCSNDYISGLYISVCSALLYGDHHLEMLLIITGQCMFPCNSMVVDACLIFVMLLNMMINNQIYSLTLHLFADDALY